MWACVQYKYYDIWYQGLAPLWIWVLEEGLVNNPPWTLKVDCVLRTQPTAKVASVFAAVV